MNMISIIVVAVYDVMKRDEHINNALKNHGVHVNDVVSIAPFIVPKAGVEGFAVEYLYISYRWKT